MGAIRGIFILLAASSLIVLSGCVSGVSQDNYVDKMIQKCPDRIRSAEGSYCVAYRKVALVKRSPALLKKTHIEQGLTEFMEMDPGGAEFGEIADAVRRGLCEKESLGVYYSSGGRRIYSVIWFDPEKSELNFSVTRTMTKTSSIAVPGEDASTGGTCPSP